MWIVEKTEFGGVIGFNGYDGGILNNFEKDLKKTVHCPEDFKVVSEKLIDGGEAIGYMPQTAYSTAQATAYSPTGQGYNTFGSVGQTQYVPFSYRRTWRELKYACGKPSDIRISEQ